MAQIDNTKKPPQFDGTNYPYWKSKMTTHIKSINRREWKMVETKIEIADLKNPTVAEEVLLQNNDIALVPFMMQLMREHLSKSRILRWLMRLGRSWKNYLRALKL